jgi:hypothetical protein
MMADETTNDDTGQQNTDQQTDGQPAGTGDQNDDQPARLRREASNYRRRLRSVEAERDRLAAEVRNLRVREIERIAQQRMADASDLWSRVSLDDLLGEDGVDYEKVTAVVDEALTDKPHWATRRPAGNADQGARSPAVSPLDFAALLQQAASGRQDR